jgi:hypothetical protein
MGASLIQIHVYVNVNCLNRRGFLFWLGFYLGYPSYSGLECQIRLCNMADPKTCDAFVVNDCININVLYFCPRFNYILNRILP